MPTNIWIASHIKLFYIPCCQKLKQRSEVAIPTQIFSIFPELKLHFQGHFSDFDASAKEISILQNLFNCIIELLSPKLQLEVINTHCKWHAKRCIKRRIKSLNAFQTMHILNWNHMLVILYLYVTVPIWVKRLLNMKYIKSYLKSSINT